MADVVGLQGENVRLVPVDVEAHLEHFLRWFNDPEVTHNLAVTKPMTRLKEKQMLEQIAESRTMIQWVILDENGHPIGTTGIRNISWREGNGSTGIVIGEKTAWGKGYGSDAVRTRTRYAFKQLGLRRLQTETFADNTAIIHCLEKVGYQQVGTLRKRRWRDGQWCDCILWDCLAEDFRDQPR